MTDENEALEADDLDEIFEDETEESVTETEETEVKGETDETETQESDEPAPPADKESEEPKLVPIAALHDKARRVQELREENEKLKSQIPQTEQKPDMYEDPEAYEAWVEAKAEEKFLLKQQAAETERLETSRSEMLESHEDYVEKEDIFLFMVSKDPSLTDEMLSSSNPAKFAYEKGNEFLKQQEDALRAKILAESSSEDSDDVEVPPKKVAPSLASASAPPNTVKIEQDEDLDDMFADQAY
jgi:hypothetical protein